MFHRQSDEEFEEVISVSLFGAPSVARAAMSVMRRAGYGRIVMVASTAGLHGLVGESAYAARKGGMIALGRTLAAEGGPRGVLTTIVLPYALTQMTEQGVQMPEHREVMSAASVAPVVVALADPECRLNGESIVVGGGRLRRASAVDWASLELDDGVRRPERLAEMIEQSCSGRPSEFPHALAAFEELMGLER
jgi:NAD(P)-dependent dehydrogenase (short-subunit alcohol dehydrogenase family)